MEVMLKSNKIMANAQAKKDKRNKKKALMKWADDEIKKLHSLTHPSSKQGIDMSSQSLSYRER